MATALKWEGGCHDLFDGRLPSRNGGDLRKMCLCPYGAPNVSLSAFLLLARLPRRAQKSRASGKIFKA